MNSGNAVEERIQTLRRRWESVVDVPEEPRSVMNVVEYGLGDRRRAEVYINRILRYFLDPSEPHGMGTDFLRAFLECLPEELRFREDVYDLSDVKVGEQKTVRKSKGDPGYLDLLLRMPAEWFLVVELKFGAREKGTEFYCKADSVGGDKKDEFESGGYYLYLHRGDRPEASGECFANWTWRAFVDEFIDEFLQIHGARHPQRTVNQLREFRYDIKQISGMSEHEQSRDEKAELFIDNYEMLTDLNNAFENRWDEFADEWYDLLPERFDDEPIVDEWVFWEHSNDWAYLYKEGWWRRTDTFEPIDAPVDSHWVRVGFLHRLEKYRELAVQDHTLKFQFRNCPPNKKEEFDAKNFRDAFVQHFDARRDEIARALPERAALTGNMHNQIEATYPIQVGEHKDFFDAYITALKIAFDEHVTENPELVELLDAAYHETVDELR